MIDDLPAGGVFILVKAGAGAVRIVNNLFSGPGTVLSGPGELQHNRLAARSDFIDPANFDYRLKEGAAPRDQGAFGYGQGH